MGIIYKSKQKPLTSPKKYYLMCGPVKYIIDNWRITSRTPPPSPEDAVMTGLEWSQTLTLPSLITLGLAVWYYLRQDMRSMRQDMKGMEIRIKDDARVAHENISANISTLQDVMKDNISELRKDVREMREDVKASRGDMTNLSGRVGNIEGSLKHVEGRVGS